MSENESVERMAARLSDGAGWGPLADMTNDLREHWHGIARIALTFHPAVDVLRDCVRNAEEYGAMSPSLTQRARTVLASLPKDTDAQR